MRKNYQKFEWWSNNVYVQITSILIIFEKVKYVDIAK
jgi:hypothetical protein